MHEMGLAEGIRGIVLDHARTLGFARMNVLRLEIIDLPGRALCTDCMVTVEIGGRLDPCPRCGGGLIPDRGDEMRVRDMEVV